MAIAIQESAGRSYCPILVGGTQSDGVANLMQGAGVEVGEARTNGVQLLVAVRGEGAGTGTVDVELMGPFAQPGRGG